jgi:hypothetical protein
VGEGGSCGLHALCGHLLTAADAAAAVLEIEIHTAKIR